jgi:hypothetical protein
MQPRKDPWEWLDKENKILARCASEGKDMKSSEYTVREFTSLARRAKVLTGPKAEASERELGGFGFSTTSSSVFHSLEREEFTFWGRK